MTPVAQEAQSSAQERQERQKLQESLNKAHESIMSFANEQTKVQGDNLVKTIAAVHSNCPLCPDKERRAKAAEEALALEREAAKEVRAQHDKTIVDLMMRLVPS